MNDAELEQLLRRSNPATIPEDAALTVRQAAMLERIVAQPDTSAPRRRRRAWWAAVPLAAALAALAVVAVSVLHPLATVSASAYGPAPLTYTASTLSVEEVISMATERAQTSPTLATPERAAVSTSWNLRVDDAGSPQQVTEIVPSVANLTWAEDLSGHLVTTVGESYPVDGVSGTPGDGSGKVIDDRIYGPGEYPALVPDARALDRRGLKDLLSLVVTDPQLPGDALPIVQGLLSEWTLTGEQHAWLLEALGAYGHLRVLGTTTDRLGRDVIAIAAPSSDGRQATFFLSMSTGRVIGVEQTVLGTDDALGVPQGTVISYTMWKDAQ